VTAALEDTTVKYKTLAITVVMVLGAAGAAAAHHSKAFYNLETKVTVTGTLTEFIWTNPHTWIVVSVKDPDAGDDVEWRLEGGGPYGLANRGWSRSSLKVGDEIVAVVSPLRDGTPGGEFVSVSANGVPVGEGE
jgi:hypothetical protein